MKQKTRCEMCDHIFFNDDALMGKNPFMPAFTIYGCPHCKEIEHFTPVCNERGCQSDIDEHYIWLSLCYEHGEKMDKESIWEE